MAIKATVFAKTLETMLANKRFASLKDVFSTMQPADIAAVFDGIPDESLPLLYRLLPKTIAADAFSELAPETQERLINGLADSELGEVVSELYTDDAAGLAEEMPPDVVDRVLSQAAPDKRQLINEILSYPEHSAGSIMTTEYVDLLPDMTAAQAIEHIRRVGTDKRTISTCYVTNEQRLLIGILSIRALILDDGSTVVSALMEASVVSVTTLDDQEKAAEVLAKYDFNALPVVDGENRLVGIVTEDDAMDVLVDEATEDMEKMAAIAPSEEPYLKTPIWKLWKARIGWLLVLMISATFTGLIITHFENALAACVTLTAYIPMLMDTGGNAGSQSSTTVVRSISLHELGFGDIFRVVWIEARVSIVCGLTLAVVNFAKLLWFDRVGAAVALVVCVTLVCTVFAAKLVGGVLPLLARKLGFDPAVCASPLLTTVVDALSLLIYFRVATIVLGI